MTPECHPTRARMPQNRRSAFSGESVQHAVLLPGKSHWLIAFRGPSQAILERLSGITPTIEVASRAIPEETVRRYIQARNPGLVWDDVLPPPAVWI